MPESDIAKLFVRVLGGFDDRAVDRGSWISKLGLVLSEAV